VLLHASDLNRQDQILTSNTVEAVQAALVMRLAQIISAKSTTTDLDLAQLYACLNLANGAPFAFIYVAAGCAFATASGGPPLFTSPLHVALVIVVASAYVWKAAGARFLAV